MNRLFLRVFGGLLLTLLVVGLFSSFLYNSVNLVRSEHYRAVTSMPAFEWLASQNRASLASIISRLSTTGVGKISVTPKSEFNLTSIELERLSYGQVLVVELDHGYRIVKQLELAPDQVVSVWLPSVYTGINQIAGQIIVDQLNADRVGGLSKAKRDSHEAELSRVFNASISRIEGPDEILHADVLERLVEAGRYFYPGNENVSAMAYYRLDDGVIYRITFAEPFSTVSWSLIIALSLMAIAGVAVAVYLLISSIDRRLRSIETVASRIARGELDARISVGRQDAIGRLGNAFNSMAEHIQRLVAVQREMIHAVSHELRTPVARIRFGVQMIEDCTSEKSLHKQLTGIDSDIQELDELIDEILTYARLEQGGPILTFQDVDVKGIVEQVVSEQGSVKPEMTIEAQFAEGVDQWKQSDVEYRYIHRAVQNLVGNATRYAASTVKVYCAFDKDTCRIDVEDDGKGIPEEDWEKVFTPFARLDDSRTRSSGGYGLGLSIVRRILYWHGGQAFLGRSAMGGAKFSLVWPRRQQAD